MTKEQFNKLQPYEQQLLWAIKSNFIHMSSGEFGAIAEIYKELYNETITRTQSACNTCRLKALKRIGNDYFKKKEEIEERAKKAEEKKKAEEEKKKAAEAKKNKGAGRPPKIDLNA